MRSATIPIALLALAGPTSADQLPLFNTGVDASGSLLPVDATDPHWTVVAGPVVTANQPAFITESQLVYAPRSRVRAGSGSPPPVMGARSIPLIPSASRST